MSLGGDEPAPIRIVIADDHSIVRRGLRTLLDAEAGIEVVAEGDDVDSAKRYIRGHRPDVLVIDLNMPGGSTLEALPSLREEFPDTQIVVLTMQDEPAYARQALGSGVLGYVLKEAADAELVAAVRAAAKGQNYLNPRLGAKLASAPPPGPPGGLSERELHQRGAVGQSQLLLDVRAVGLHRAHRDVEALADLRVGVAQGEHPQHLSLALG
jgi:two-component system response regulator NreC